MVGTEPNESSTTTDATASKNTLDWQQLDEDCHDGGKHPNDEDDDGDSDDQDNNQDLVFLLATHKDTDILTLHTALHKLPVGFPSIETLNLCDEVQTDTDLRDLLNGERYARPGARVVILVRLLGRGVPGFGHLIDYAQQPTNRCELLVLSGVPGSVEPDLTAMSTVSTEVLQAATGYFAADGCSHNLAQLLLYLADAFGTTQRYAWEPPTVQPDHGLYHPRYSGSPDRVLETTKHLAAAADAQLPTVAVVFYRCHFLSGNTAFVDALLDEFEDLGCHAIGLFTETLRAHAPLDRVHGTPVEKFPTALTHLVDETTGRSRVDAVISTMAFAMGEVNPDGPTLGNWSTDALESLGVPVLQAINSFGTKDDWESSARGLSPLDTAMNVAIPEFDGRIVTVPVSFKAPQDETSKVHYYEPLPDRVAAVARQAHKLAVLRHKPNSEKKVVFVLTNSSGKAQRIGDAVGLDSPASMIRIFRAMAAAGYDLGDDPPTDGDRLIQDLVDRCSYDETVLTEDQLAQAAGRVSRETYDAIFRNLPSRQQEQMTEQWGKPPGRAYVHENAISLAGLEFGNVFVALQPPRGYGMDPDLIYHKPDLPPPHNYVALYRWIRDVWKADAMVHVGKHGTMEWLPGKGVGLSRDCYPDTVLDDLPLVYPFIINDPGEGTQSKRRAHALIVDHLTPPMTTADGYGKLAQLMQLVDEYYQIETLDPTKLPHIRNQIWELIQDVNLDEDLALVRRRRGGNNCNNHAHRRGNGTNGPTKAAAPILDPDDETLTKEHPSRSNSHAPLHSNHPDDAGHEHFTTLTQDSLAKMDGKAFAHLIEDMDGYLCELAGAQIRDGLHILGQVPPEGDAMVDMLQALTRLPNLDVPSLREAIAKAFGLNCRTLLSNQGACICLSPILMRLADRPLVTAGDAVETIDELAKHLLALLDHETFDAKAIASTIRQTFPGVTADMSEIHRVLEFVCQTLVPSLRDTTQEISHLMDALDGKFVPAGPSGSPTRGMAHLLPTGRNFYACDPQALPSLAAWEVGKGLAREVSNRYRTETGAYPEHVAISVWGTAAMRTHGDDIAQIFALLGVRPVWQPENHRVTGVELMPLSELGRPRIDVTMRISGFFRDAFPHLIALLDEAVNLAINADEPPEQNYIRKHFLEDMKQDDMEETSARYRIFGCPPGAYGIGILDLVEAQNWQDESDFANCYINWGGYAYSRKEIEGTQAKREFTHRLTTVEVAIHNQDDREHDIFDSDDYFQFHGGMMATIQALSGKQPKGYFGDTQDPATPRVRDIREETLRVYRTRVVNPKWLESISKHGYKGASEMAATVDYLFGFDATANVVRDFMYEEIAQSYALDPSTQDFYQTSNPWALRGISERLLEAAQRGMWEAPDPETLEALKQTLLRSDDMLEGRSEQPPGYHKIPV